MEKEVPLEKSALDPERVNEVYQECVLKSGEKDGMEGFHPERLQSHKTEIEAMLEDLPDEFKVSGGGGSSFLRGCLNKNGDLWTGMHVRVDQLFRLGSAIGKVRAFRVGEQFYIRII